MKKWWIILAMLLVPLASGYYAWQAMARQHHFDAPTIKVAAGKTGPLTLAWPVQGRAAVGLADEGKCRVNGDNGAFATASIAKVITALVVLDKHPLQPGENGPTITMTDDDVARLIATQAMGGSYAPIAAGQTLTERQMIEAVMLASSNNLADSLAIWAFGSLEDYQATAQQWVLKNNLLDTTIGDDASGLDPSTRASSLDLCQLMMVALKNPVLTEIMGASEVAFPIAGSLQNTNRLLGQQGVFAGKTGYTSEAGAGVIFATHIEIDGQRQTVVLATLGQENYDVAFAAAEELLNSLEKNLVAHNLARSGQAVGGLTSPWGGKTDLLAADDLTVTTWIDQMPDFKTKTYKNLSSLQAGQRAGTISVDGKSVEIVAANDVPGPSFFWRLLHGF
ncbi:hypothetical protein FWG95_00650 [Candidatus Saccharibacteria bacterium]|nr:hypothetical protein [Candidatus Saccharibacteria bacterium]